MTGRHAAALVGSASLVFGLVTAGVIVSLRVNPLRQTSIIGAVMVEDADPRKQLPIPNVRITGMMSKTGGTTISNAAGFFQLTIPSVLRIGRTVDLYFQKAGYEPLAMGATSGDKMIIARLRPILRPADTAPAARHTITNPRIRYTVRMESFVDIPTVVDTFEVVNVANQPCRSRPPCSPNGEWKAATGGATEDAHEHNQFRNPRVSCIAGPCPFTRTEKDLRQNGQILQVSALNWADTATFLVEADVVHSQVSDMVRESFPVVFGSGLSFTLPPLAAGLSIEAELDGQDTFFPLGPDLILSWATCTQTQTTDPDHSTLYSCELKPEYHVK
jgi:hypothetical protein